MPTGSERPPSQEERAPWAEASLAHHRYVTEHGHPRDGHSAWCLGYQAALSAQRAGEPPTPDELYRIVEHVLMEAMGRRARGDHGAPTVGGMAREVLAALDAARPEAKP